MNLLHGVVGILDEVLVERGFFQGLAGGHVGLVVPCDEELTWMGVAFLLELADLVACANL